MRSLKAHIKKFHETNESKIDSHNAIELSQMCHIDDQRMVEENKLNDSSFEDSASYILSQLNAPIPMKYIRQNEEKSVINTPSGKGYGVENFQNGENKINGTLIHKGSIHKGSKPDKFRVMENYMDITPSGKGYTAENFLKVKKVVLIYLSRCK